MATASATRVTAVHGFRWRVSPPTQGAFFPNRRTAASLGSRRHPPLPPPSTNTKSRSRRRAGPRPSTTGSSSSTSLGKRSRLGTTSPCAWAMECSSLSSRSPRTPARRWRWPPTSVTHRLSRTRRRGSLDTACTTLTGIMDYFHKRGKTHLLPTQKLKEPLEIMMQGTLMAIRDWFRDYKIPDGKPTNKFGLGNTAAKKEYSNFWNRITNSRSSLLAEQNILSLLHFRQHGQSTTNSIRRS